MDAGTRHKYVMIGRDERPVRKDWRKNDVWKKKDYFLAQAALLAVGVVLFLSLSMAVFLSLSSKAYALDYMPDNPSGLSTCQIVDDRHGLSEFRRSMAISTPSV